MSHLRSTTTEWSKTSDVEYFRIDWAEDGIGGIVRALKCRDGSWLAAYNWRGTCPWQERGLGSAEMAMASADARYPIAREAAGGEA